MNDSSRSSNDEGFEKDLLEVKNKILILHKYVNTYIDRVFIALKGSPDRVPQKGHSDLHTSFHTIAESICNTINDSYARRKTNEMMTQRSSYSAMPTATAAAGWRSPTYCWGAAFWTCIKAEHRQDKLVLELHNLVMSCDPTVEIVLLVEPHRPIAVLGVPGATTTKLLDWTAASSDLQPERAAIAVRALLKQRSQGWRFINYFKNGAPAETAGSVRAISSWRRRVKVIGVIEQWSRE